MAYPFLLDISIPGGGGDEGNDEQSPLADKDERQGTVRRTPKDAKAHNSPVDRDRGFTPDFMNGNTSDRPSLLYAGLRAKRYGERVVVDLTASDDEGEKGTMSSTPRTGHPPQVITIKPESTPDPETPRPFGNITGTQDIKPDPEEPGATWPGWASGVDAGHGVKRSASHAAEEDARDEKPPPRKRNRAKKEPSPPIYKATAKRAKGTSDIPGVLDIDDSVLAKIKKCFERAEHENASEAEARAAMFLAGKLMRQYNVEKTEVMQYKTPEELAQSAGSSEVVVERRDGAKIPIPIRQWVSDLAVAMGIFFDVKSYSSTPRDRFLVRWVFYGIAQNTASAALAFEKIYNLIVDWARFKKGIAVTNSYCLGITSQLYSDAEKEKAEEMEEVKKNEAAKLAIREKEEQLQRDKELQRLQPTVEDELDPETEKKEQLQREKDLQRLQPTAEDEPEPELESKPGPTENESSGGTTDIEMNDADLEGDLEEGFDLGSALLESGNTTSNGHTQFPGNSNEDENESDDDEPDFVHDDEANEDQYYGDTDKAIDDILKNHFAFAVPPQLASPPPEPATTSPRESPEPDAQWRSTMQLTVFRETAAKVADEYLKAKDMKLGTRRRGAKPKDAKAFKEGKRDAKKIDVRQKALEDKKQDIKEENDG